MSGLAGLVWLLPACRIKNAALRILGVRIGRSVRVGPTLVLGSTIFELGEGSSVGAGNVFRNLSRVTLGPDAFIGGFNQFTAAPAYRQVTADAGVLRLGRGAGIINRHYVDCSGPVVVGAMSMVAGLRSILQTHELDLESNRTTVGAITIGEYCFTGTGVIILQGSELPDGSMLAAGSTMTRSTESRPPGHLYVGSPARPVKAITDWSWMRRETIHTPVDTTTRVSEGDRC